MINNWSSRGLPIYGKVTIIKSLLLPKSVYVLSPLPTSKELVTQLNHSLFKFLWNSTEKITGVAAINNYEQGGLEMIDLDSTIVALRLSWMKSIFSDCGGTWKTYLIHNLERFSGL